MVNFSITLFAVFLYPPRRVEGNDPILSPGYADAEKVQLMVANQAVEDYCFSKILMYIPG